MPDLPAGISGADATAVMLRCAREAGRILAEHFRLPKVVGSKGRNNPVTETDLLAERTICDIIRAEFPDHAILSEETLATTRSDGWLWVIDPLDGTRNFSNNIPFFCVNLALMHAGEVVLGVTFDPLQEETFTAAKGSGAALNGTPLAASGRDLSQSVIGADLGYDDGLAAETLRVLAGLRSQTQSYRILGSAALSLAYVAAGRHDLYVHHYLFPWDFAAGKLLIEEAGGTATDRRGGPLTVDSHDIVAGSTRAHGELLARLEGARAS
jgi:fructose-1,6-bisphosphatase/inositol monophosphatase family enzyme